MNIIKQIFESLQARRDRENKVAAIIFGGGCLGMIVLIVVVGIIINIFNALETANLTTIYGESYASACQPIPSGRDSQANLPNSPAPRRVLLLTSATQRRHEWHAAMPNQWRAENAETVALIGCVEEQEILLETCEYLRDSARSEDAYSIRIRRYQYQSTLILLDAQSARRIDSLTIIGTEPEPCPEDDGSLRSREVHGTEVAWADFAGWVEAYIFSE